LLKGISSPTVQFLKSSLILCVCSPLYPNSPDNANMLSILVSFLFHPCSCYHCPSLADFNEDASKETWDRIKVRCTQHLKKDKPFGLAMMRITANDTVMKKVR
jgi:hypothetical protein